MFNHPLHDTDLPETRKRAAGAYEILQHAPEHAYVRLSYLALQRVIKLQFLQLDDAGFTFQFDSEDPYGGNSSLMHADLERGVLRVFADRSATLPEDHPFKPLVGGSFGDLTWNDVFRGVHDVMGHGIAGTGFGPVGEYQAWLAHRATMPRIALSALWCETRGQNTWTNFWANHSDLPVSERPYGEQKAGIAPWDVR